MMRTYWFRNLKTALLGGLLWFAGTLIQRAHAVTDSAPWNFVMLLMDDAGWRDLGFTGNDFIETPHLDQLASEGMIFTTAYATHPFCAPTRQSLLTGQWPARTAWMQRSEVNNPDAPRPGPPFTPYTAKAWTEKKPEFISLPRLLKDAGYATGHIGKWHFGIPSQRDIRPETVGFDLNFGGAPDVGAVQNYFAPFQGLPGNVESRPGEYLTDRLNEEAIQFIKENKDRPFYLQLWHYAPHLPMQAPEETVMKYRRKKAKMNDPTLNPTYAAMIEHIDRGMGQIRQLLRDLNIDDRTVIVVASDNGAQVLAGSVPLTSVAPMSKEKGYVYEGGIRVPISVYWPDHIRPDSVSSIPVSVLDFYPTVLEMAGIPLPVYPAPDGKSLVSLLQGDAEGWADRPLFWYNVTAGIQDNGDVLSPVASVRRGPWKLIHNYGFPLELYQLENDPGESINLAKSHAAKTAELKELLDEWVVDTGVAPPVPNPQYQSDYLAPKQVTAENAPVLTDPVAVWYPGGESSPWIQGRMSRAEQVDGVLRIHADGIYPEVRARDVPTLPAGVYAARLQVRHATGGRLRFHWVGESGRGVVELFPKRDGEWHTITALFEASEPITGFILAGPTHLGVTGLYDPETQPDYIELRKVELFEVQRSSLRTEPR